MTDDIKLAAVLERHQAPAPATDLQRRILNAAKASEQTPIAANDRPRRWRIPAVIAASLVVAVFAGLSLTADSINAEDQAWQSAATETGFADLYDWVYGEG